MSLEPVVEIDVLVDNPFDQYLSLGEFDSSNLLRGTIAQVRGFVSPEDGITFQYQWDGSSWRERSTIALAAAPGSQLRSQMISFIPPVRHAVEHSRDLSHWQILEGMQPISSRRHLLSLPMPALDANSFFRVRAVESAAQLFGISEKISNTSRIWIVDNNSTGVYTGIDRPSRNFLGSIDQGDKSAGTFSSETVFNHLKNCWMFLKEGDVLYILNGDMTENVGLPSLQSFDSADWILPNNVTVRMGEFAKIGHLRLSDGCQLIGGQVEELSLVGGGSYYVAQSRIGSLSADMESQDSPISLFVESSEIISKPGAIAVDCASLGIGSRVYCKNCLIKSEEVDAIVTIDGQTVSFESCKIGAGGVTPIDAVFFLGEHLGMNEWDVRFIADNQLFGMINKFFKKSNPESKFYTVFEGLTYSSFPIIVDDDGGRPNSQKFDPTLVNGPYPTYNRCKLLPISVPERESDLRPHIDGGHFVDLMLGVGQSNMSRIFAQSVMWGWTEATGGKPYLWERASRSGNPIVTWSTNNSNNLAYQQDFELLSSSLDQRAVELAIAPEKIRRTIFWNQGEADCLAGTSEETYFIRLETIISRIRSQWAVDRIILCLPDIEEGKAPSGYTDEKMQPIRSAILAYADLHSDTEVVDMNTDLVPRPLDGLHITQNQV